MKVATLAERNDRALVLVGQTLAYAETIGEINRSIQGADDTATITILLALAERLLEKSQAAGAEAATLAAITAAGLSAEKAQR